MMTRTIHHSETPSGNARSLNLQLRSSHIAIEAIPGTIPMYFGLTKVITSNRMAKAPSNHVGCLRISDLIFSISMMVIVARCNNRLGYFRVVPI